jgi:hypothetical protein
MGKRSDFARRERDFYPTPVAAVEPLIPHLPERFTYIEPCFGDGALVRALSSFEGVAHGGLFCPMLEYASDIELPPTNHGMRRAVYMQDALSIEEANVDFFITNPPWSRPVLHRLILHLSEIRPTWLLFDADWMHTKQAAPYLEYCRKIVSVGRVKWIPDSPHTGKDNACWYLFDYGSRPTPPEFWGKPLNGDVSFRGNKPEKDVIA